MVERDLVEVVAAPRDRRATELLVRRAERLDAGALRIRHVGLRRAHEVRRHDAALAVVELDVYHVAVAPGAHLDDRRRDVELPPPVKGADGRADAKPPPPPRRRRRQVAQRVAEGPVAQRRLALLLIARGAVRRTPLRLCGYVLSSIPSRGAVTLISTQRAACSRAAA